MLKVHVILLSFAHLKSGLEILLHGNRTFCRSFIHTFACQHEHGISREDGRIGIPAAVHSRLSPPHICLVHEVIMEQGVVMKHLQGDGSIHMPFCVLVKKLCSQQEKHRSDALAPQ